MGQNCKRNSWIAAVVLGIIVFLVALPVVLEGLIFGVIAAAVVGFGLTMFVCRDEGASTQERQSPEAVAAPVAAPTSGSTAATAAPARSTTTEQAGTTASGLMARDDTAPAPKNAPAPETKSEAVVAEDATATSAETTPAEPTVAKPATDDAEAPTTEAPAKVAAEKAPAGTAKAATAPSGTAKKPASLAALDAPRDGKADDLKVLKGVGPVTEKDFHAHGIYHFDQIAGLSAAEMRYLAGVMKGTSERELKLWKPEAKKLAKS